MSLLSWVAASPPPQPHVLSAFYLLLTLLCFISTLHPSLSNLSLHGQSLYRYQPSKSNLLNKLLLLPISKRCFKHFYFLGLLISFILSLTPHRSLTLSLFFLHCLRRLAECLFVQVITPHSRMSLSAYLLGLSFYTVTPFIYLSPVTSTSQFLPMLSFATFSFLQYYSHSQLAALRVAPPPTDPYPPPPTTVLFRYSLHPHYFCEIMLYLSLLYTHTTPTYTSILATPAACVVLWCYVSLTVSGHRATAHLDEQTVAGRNAVFPAWELMCDDVSPIVNRMKIDSMERQGSDVDEPVMHRMMYQGDGEEDDEHKRPNARKKKKRK